MRDGMRRSAGLALLLGILWAPPVRSQDQPAQTQSAPDRSNPAARAWSDPPTKPAEPQGPAEPAPTQSAAKPAPARTSRPAAAAARSTLPTTRTVARPARAAPTARNAERRIPARRAAETRLAARPGRGSVVAPPPARSVLRAPPARVARPLPPEMRGSDVDLWVDARADRIRRARDGGFLVMRRSTVEDPMGRRMQILRPLDDDDE
ncbi:hypothetical protein FF100_25485 [Methylobacterium terricola]|uniref:Uncharacterized protein n=1 Tax=Methylobacterium terricola TaxID=2583531 RepID=A0A5C4LDE1_9HYPH|nr:hypothetical protein [Methylobacterium terricola]TNC09572.1 hypothetical protein FF100_25485 [Methylobacterium terricola]